MPISILGSDFLEMNLSHIGTNPVPVILKGPTDEQIKCVINARVLLHTNKIDSGKFYKFFPTYGIISSDGFGHYIDNPRISSELEKPGCFINYDDPIFSNASLEYPNGIVIGYKGCLTGVCLKKDMFLPFVGMDTNGVKNIQYGYRPGDVLLKEEIGTKIGQCNYISVGSIEIPIYDDPDGAGKTWNLSEGVCYTFDCYFGDDEGYGSSSYPQYAEYLYLSGLITDEDFDPQKDHQ